MDVVIYQPKRYQVGEIISCLYETKKFESRILKVYDKHMAIYAPLQIGEFMHERRRLPRVDTNFTAMINDYMSEKVYEFKPSIEVQVIDFNIKGFGFLATRDLKTNSPYYLHINIDDDPLLEEDLIVKVMVHHKRMENNVWRYGCEILSITNEASQRLRMFILNQQLINYILKVKDTVQH
ncbi:PilZ domain-containing protein [Bacillus tianshenii]|nr:PilZ domain-containing protein [Bacillus tianshenii]